MTDDRLDALAALDRTPAGLNWATVEDVGRTMRRRRRGRGTGAVVVAALAAVGVIVGLHSPADQPVPVPVRVRVISGVHVAARVPGGVELVADGRRNTPAADRADTSTVARAETSLTMRLLSVLPDHANESVSAPSLLALLAMLQTGARGGTAQQLQRASSGLSAPRQNAAYAALTAQLAAAAARDDVVLQSVNSLWQQSGFTVRPQFLAELSAYFGTGVWQADFAHHPDRAAAAINRWAAAHTHGRIMKLFDQLDPSTVLVLANALYFHASWAKKFDPDLTKPAQFTTGSGRQVSAEFMSGVGIPAAVTSRYSAAVLPYAGGRFTALAIMPRSGSLSSFVGGLTPTSLDTIARAASSAHSAAVLLPKFTTSSTTDLAAPLRALGVTDLFGRADLSGISRSGDLSVGQAVQRVYVSVAERGTTAAAVTGAVIATSGIRTDVDFDRPFLFLVRDRVTGAVLFATKVQDPSGH